MALDRIKGRIAYICDECQDGLETDFYDIEEAKEAAKDNGWVTMRREDLKFNPPKLAPNAKYMHLCMNCYSNRE